MDTDKNVVSSAQVIEQTEAANESYNGMRSRTYTGAVSSTATQGNGTATGINKGYDSMRSRTLELPLARALSLAPTPTSNQNSSQKTTNEKVDDGMRNRFSTSASRDTGTPSTTTTTAIQAGAKATG